MNHHEAIQRHAAQLADLLATIPAPPQSIVTGAVVRMIDHCRGLYGADCFARIPAEHWGTHKPLTTERDQ